MSGHPKQTAIFTRPFDYRGDGLRVAVKDTLDMVGEVTTGGSRALQDAPAARQDADVVSALRAADCQIIGRTNMHELAYGVTGTNSWTGTPTNPKYPRLIPGGSSSGSAVAVAAGLADFAIGSDTGGSIRVPATCCGIVGLKPTFGRVSRRGAVPAYTTLDCIGPFARDVAGIEQAMAIIAPGWLPAATHAAGRKVAFVVTDTDQPIADLVRSRGEALFDLHDVELADFLSAADGGLKVIARETWDAFGYLIETGLVGRDVHDRLVMSSRVTDAQLAEAETTRTRFSAAVDAALIDADALLLPAFPCPVPSLYEAADIAAAIPITTNCRPFNLSGHPAIVLPAGEIEGRPVGLQLIGRKGGDEALCALARHIPLFEKGSAR